MEHAPGCTNTSKTIPQELIEKALALTGKKIEDMSADVYHEFNFYTNFSIEKFCYYLLSPEFIEKYSKSINGEFFFDGQEERAARMFGMNIHRYQKGNSQPLIDLLSKI